MMTYAIVATREFYGPETRRSLVEDQETGNPITFPDRASAKAYLANYDSGRYYLSHNESGRPTYAIRRVDGLPAYLTAWL